jgi:hypothetical protein
MNVLALLRQPTGHLWIALGLAAVAVLPTAVAAQSGPEIMKKHRQVHRVKDEEEQLLLRLVSKSGAVKERRVTRFTMNGADDLNKILIRFLAPRDVENTALLTWEAKDGNDDQWLYLPATRNPKRIAAAGKKNRFMGTDFTYEDLRPENLPVHVYRLGAEAIDGQDCWVLLVAGQTLDVGVVYLGGALDPDATNHVEVRVMNGAEPVPGAQVTATSTLAGALVALGAWEKQPGGTVVRVKTDAKGVALFDRLPPNFYDFFSEAELTRGGS